jgi:hypothetical protein
MLSQQSPRLFLLLMKRRTTSTCNTCCESSMLSTNSDYGYYLSKRFTHKGTKKVHLYTTIKIIFSISWQHISGIG